MGCRFEYAVQENPNGLAEAFIIGESFVGSDKVALILGDNIFYGSGLSAKLQDNSNPEGGIITFEAPIHISNVMLIDPSSDDPTRYRTRIDADGTKERISTKSGNPIPRP